MHPPILLPAPDHMFTRRKQAGRMQFREAKRHGKAAGQAQQGAGLQSGCRHCAQVAAPPPRCAPAWRPVPSPLPPKACSPLAPCSGLFLLSRQRKHASLPLLPTPCGAVFPQSRSHGRFHRLQAGRPVSGHGPGRRRQRVRGRPLRRRSAACSRRSEAGATSYPPCACVPNGAGRLAGYAGRCWRCWWPPRHRPWAARQSPWGRTPPTTAAGGPVLAAAPAARVAGVAG